MTELNHNIYIVDDDPAVSSSLQLMLETIGCCVSTFPDGESFLNSNLQTFQGCVLLDVRMPGKDGLTVLREALDINPNLEIIMMSGHGDITMAISALKAGAQDFIEKPFRAGAILAALSKACDKISTQETDQKFEENAKQNLARLTPREHEVLERLVEGKPNKIIAFELAISIRTVETHRANIMQKTQLRSLAELIKMHISVPH